MGKKVIFNGIEILTEEGDASAHNLLEFVEDVVDGLESNLDEDDENFHLTVSLDFGPSRPPQHTFSLTNLSNRDTRRKVVDVIKRTAGSDAVGILGSVHIDLQVEDA